MQSSQAQARFWQWFQKHAERLRTSMYGPDDAARERVSAELREAVETVEPGLVLEFSSGGEDEPHQLIVSADGRFERVDPVKDFVASAPTMPGWQVVAFRPRMPMGESLEIRLQDESVGPDDIWFRVLENDDGLDLTLHVRGLTKANEQLRGLGASLLAEHAVGERDALTMIRSLQIEPLPKTPEAAGLHPFLELAGVFDEAKAAKYPPPGSLAIDLENDWANMEGTVNGALAVVLLHVGLRSAAGHPDYDRRLTVSMPFHETLENGLPTREEFAVVCDLGDRVVEELREDQESLLAMTMMTQGRRDLIFYTSNADAALQRVEALRDAETSHEIETSVERDTFWGMYRSFCQAGSEDDTEE